MTLSGLTVAGGNVVSSSSNYGGGLLNSGTLTVNNCTFTGNTIVAGGTKIEGGGLLNNGKATVNNSTFAKNTADTGGDNGAVPVQRRGGAGQP